MKLQESGFEIIPSFLSADLLREMRDGIFKENIAGERCLLDHPLVREAAITIKRQLSQDGYLPPAAVAIQAIAFDKTPSTNWTVAWHQDLVFPFARKVSAAGFEVPTIKNEIHHSRPPEAVLGQLLAARLHLDECGETNGPLRVAPGSHRHGVIPSNKIAETVNRHGEIACLAQEGEILLMRPLALHASSKATRPGRRRVIHLVYHSGETMPEPWHRAV